MSLVHKPYLHKSELGFLICAVELGDKIFFRLFLNRKDYVSTGHFLYCITTNFSGILIQWAVISTNCQRDQNYIYCQPQAQQIVSAMAFAGEMTRNLSRESQDLSHRQTVPSSHTVSRMDPSRDNEVWRTAEEHCKYQTLSLYRKV